MGWCSGLSVGDSIGKKREREREGKEGKRAPSAARCGTAGIKEEIMAQSPTQLHSETSKTLLRLFRLVSPTATVQATNANVYPPPANCFHLSITMTDGRRNIGF